MNSQALSLAMLAVFASLAMNIMLQCGLGMRGLTRAEEKGPPLAKLGIIFITVLLLWTVFSYILSSLSLEFLAFILIFPLSSLTFFALENLTYRFILKKEGESGASINCCDGLAAASLFITFNIAGGFAEAVILSFGFVLGILLSFLILGEIRRRAMMEAVPRFLRGSPLVLVSMGLLSLIFSSAALMLFRAIGG